jgi:hypothetical protein
MYNNREKVLQISKFGLISNQRGFAKFSNKKIKENQKREKRKE